MKMVFTSDDFIAGWVGGISGLLVGHPLETVKVRQQTMGGRFLTAGRRTFKYEGVRGFFKGITLPLFTVAPSNALFFGISGNIKNLYGNAAVHNHKISLENLDAIKHIYIAGVIGGFFQTVFICPVELIKTILQAKTEGKGTWQRHYEVPYSGCLDALRCIARDRGAKGLYRGLLPLMLRDIPTSGLYTVSYEILMYHSFSQWNVPVIVKQILAGGTAGVISWMFVFPLDVVKNRMQVDNPHKPRYHGMLDCFRKSYREGGLRVFFKGAPTTLVRTFPVNAAIFLGYEATLARLRD